MFRFRAKRKDNGEWVVGQYVHDPGHGLDFILEVEDFHGKRILNNHFIHPHTLSISTGKPDSTEQEIFGSFPLGGEMTVGGDMVNVQYHGLCEVRYNTEIQAFMLWHIGRNKMLEWLGVHSPIGLTIIGKGGG